MSVLNKDKHTQMMRSLRFRFQALENAVQGRELHSSEEGCKGHRSWLHPDKMIATEGNSLDISMAIEDFKTILTEFKKLK